MAKIKTQKVIFLHKVTKEKIEMKLQKTPALNAMPSGMQLCYFEDQETIYISARLWPLWKKCENLEQQQAFIVKRGITVAPDGSNLPPDLFKRLMQAIE